MLEAIRERSQSWLGKLILTAITVPFALWGIDSYLRNAGSSVAVAKVGGQSVTVQEYGNALQNFRNQMQSSGKTDPALLDSPEAKQAVLDKLIVGHLMDMQVRHAGLALSDEQLGKVILAMPEFQKDGKFSQDQYDQILSQNQLSPSRFEAKMRDEVLVGQLKTGVVGGAFVPNALADHGFDIEHQQREVSVAEYAAKDFVPQVKLAPETVKSYYDKNVNKFRVPEQVKFEYLVLSANSLLTEVTVSEEEIKKYYTENSEKFQGDEQRRASHILIGLSGKSDAATKAAALKKAESVLAEVKKSPEKFDVLAKKYSQDPGSAEKGGDLGLFGRGAMVKAFENAVFNMKPGAISDLVESEFGYHIIKLTEIQGQSQDYQSVRANIRAELLYQKALAKFAEKAESFSNMVYEQSTSLQPAAQAFGLQVQSSPLMSRADINKFMKSDKLTNALFSNEVLKDKRNSEAVEVSPNTLVAARVVEYKPSTARPFAEISSALDEYLKLEEAAVLAKRQGEAAIAQFSQGKDVAGLSWAPAVVIDRQESQGLSGEVVGQAFKIDSGKVPAYAGIQNKAKGYTLIKVSKVESATNTSQDDKKSYLAEMQSAQSAELMNAYIQSLKNVANISVNKQLMGDAQQQ